MEVQKFTTSEAEPETVEQPAVEESAQAAALRCIGAAVRSHLDRLQLVSAVIRGPTGPSAVRIQAGQVHFHIPQGPRWIWVNGAELPDAATRRTCRAACNKLGLHDIAQAL